ncbi:hypothetical protein ACJJI4_09425 [Microbulbifer sp. TRSA002]|uniref:hypothetical protein n=1 Tax=Microbulbifer sp. TRSA002 TaxID=3243382 RepID=UPI004039B3E1
MSSEITSKKNTISTFMELSSLCSHLSHKRTIETSETQLHSSGVDFQKYIDINKGDLQSNTDPTNWSSELANHIDGNANDLNINLEDANNFIVITDLLVVISNNLSLDSKINQSYLQHYLLSINKPPANGSSNSQIHWMSGQTVRPVTLLAEVLDNPINEVLHDGDSLQRTELTAASLNFKPFKHVHSLQSDLGSSDRIEDADIDVVQQVILPTTNRIFASQLNKLSDQKSNSTPSLLYSLNTEIDTVVVDKEMVRAEILIRSLHDTRVSISLHEGALTVNFDSVDKGFDLSDSSTLSELRSMLEQKYSQLQVSVTTSWNVSSDLEEDINGSSRQNDENSSQGENSESRHQSDDGLDIEVLLDDGLNT